MLIYVYNNGQLIFQMSSFAEAKPSVAAPAAPACGCSSCSGCFGYCRGCFGRSSCSALGFVSKKKQSITVQVTRHISCVDDIFTYFYIYLYIQMIPISSNTLPLLSLCYCMAVIEQNCQWHSGLSSMDAILQALFFRVKGSHNFSILLQHTVADRALTFSRLKRPNKPLANQTSGFNTFFIPFLLES